MEENFGKKKLLKILIPTLVVVLILVTVFVFIKIQNSPKKLFMKAIDKVFSKIEAEEVDKKTESSIKITADIKSESEDLREINKHLQNSYIELNTQKDLENEILKCNPVINYQGDNLLDGDIIIQDQKLYVFAEELFGKYLEITPDDINKVNEDIDLQKELKNIFESANKVSAKENNKLLSEIKGTIKTYLKDKEFSQSKEKLTINNDKVNATKTTIVLNGKQFAKLYGEILQTLRDSKYFISLFEPIKELDSEYKIEEILDEMIQYLEDYDEDINITISIYTKGIFPQFIKGEIIINEEDEELTKITYTKESDEKSEIKMTEYEEELFKINITKINDKETEYIFTSPEEEDVELIIKVSEENDKNGQIEIIAKLPNEAMSIYDVYGDTKINANIEYSYDNKAKIEKENTRNSTTIKEITQAEQEEIMKKFEKSKLYELVEKYNEMSTGLLRKANNSGGIIEDNLDYDDMVEQNDLETRGFNPLEIETPGL